MPLDYAAIGGRLQARRKELGITQEDAAERVGITVVYLSKIENGRVHPTLDLLDRLCCVLEYDLARAFTGVQTTSPDYGQSRCCGFSTPVRRVSSLLFCICWSSWQP